MGEVQKHGFIWEKEILAIFGITEESTPIKYTHKTDLPLEQNRLGEFDVSIKTTGNLHTVCMADCLRVYDAVHSERPIHMVVVHYQQVSSKKKLVSIIEVDLTLSGKLLFGDLLRSQLEELRKAVTIVPHARSPTPEEHASMYTVRNQLELLLPKPSYVKLNIKCNSTQSRLQCSLNHFQDFIKNNPDRILSNGIELRGHNISSELVSCRRVFRATL